MSNIIKKKRIFKTVEKLVYKNMVFKNPDFIPQDAANCERIGTFYNIRPEIRIHAPEMQKVRISHIHYEIECKQCKNKEWVKRKDAQYCSPACRKDASKERKEASSLNNNLLILLCYFRIFANIIFS